MMVNRNCLKLRVFGLFFGLIILCASPVFAQTTSGTILGQVTDPQAAAIPQAAVSAKNVDTGLTQNAVTNDNGEYALLNLPPGTYTISVTKDGFTTTVSNSNRLFIDQKLRINVQLTVGAVSATVDVSSEAPVLQTQTTETSQVVETKRISDLPLLGRNFLDLTRLSPGVTSGQGSNTLNISVNGQRESANSVIVDGIEVTANRNNDSNLSPSVDSVQEFKLLTSAYAPEFGKASGAVVSIQTKAGSNAFHGSVYEFFRPTETAARQFFSPERGNLQQNNYGGTIGGPIVKNKLFFFFSYEATRNHDSFSYVDSVPPIGQIKFLPNGDVDLSGLKDPYTGNPVAIFNPVYYANNFTPQRFTGSIIPAAFVSKAGKAVLQKLFPSPEQAGTINGYYNNFIVSQPYRLDQNRIEGKIDYNLSDKDRMVFAYHYTPFNYLRDDRYAGKLPIAGGGDADQADQGDAVNQSGSFAETHIFSNSLVNEFRFGYTRYKLDNPPLVTDPAIASSLGFGNINLANFPQTNGIPQIQLGTGYVTGGSTYKPLNFLDSNFQFVDNVSKQFGSHSFKAGIDFRFLNVSPKFSLYPTGYFYFNGPYGSVVSGDPNYCNFNYTDCNDATGFYDSSFSSAFPNGGSDIADLLLGYPSSVSIGLQFTDPKTKAHERSFYAQDSWQVNQKLVLNFGLRYEYQSPYTEKNNNISNFDPATKQILLAGRGGNSKSLVKPDKNNFMPRLGISYKFDDRTVLRAGYGIFYSPENDGRSDVLTKNYPFATQSVYFNSPYSLAYNLDTGVTRTSKITIPDGAASINALAIPNSASQQFFYVDPNLVTGYSQLYNVVLQREIFSQFTVEAGYVGSLSRKLSYAVGNINANNAISSNLGAISGQFSRGEGNYNSLQTKVDKRFSRGASLFAAYTFSKCIDNGPAPFNLGKNAQSPQNPNNLDAERAVCGNDVKHNFVSSFLYELPIGKGRKFLGDSNAIVDALIGGWQINGIYNLRSGLPFTVVLNSANGATVLRPNLVGDPNVSDPTLTKYFNTAAFSAAGVSVTNPGSAGRNILRGPGYSNLDFSTFKTFKLSRLREGANLEVRFEFFNITNSAHFANPNSVINGGSFGQITSASGARVIQFAGKFNF